METMLITYLVISGVWLAGELILNGFRLLEIRAITSVVNSIFWPLHALFYTGVLAKLVYVIYINTISKDKNATNRTSNSK